MVNDGTRSGKTAPILTGVLSPTIGLTAARLWPRVYENQQKNNFPVSLPPLMSYVFENDFHELGCRYA